MNNKNWIRWKKKDETLFRVAVFFGIDEDLRVEEGS